MSSPADHSRLVAAFVKGSQAAGSVCGGGPASARHTATP